MSAELCLIPLPQFLLSPYVPLERATIRNFTKLGTSIWEGRRSQGPFLISVRSGSVCLDSSDERGVLFIPDITPHH